MQPSEMPLIKIADTNALTVKHSKSGYRIKRVREQTFVFVRPGELIGLINALADAHETQETSKAK